MSKRSFARSFFIPSDQLTSFVLFLLAIYAPLLPGIWILVPPPYSYVIDSIVAIIVLILLPVFYIRTIVRKELLFNFIDHDSLLDNLAFSPSMNVGIFYKGIPVSKDQLHTLMLKIHNGGNTRIETKDFNGKQVLIKFPEEIKVLDVAAKDKRSGEVIPGKPVVLADQHSVDITSFKLGVHDWFHIRFIFAYYDGSSLMEKIKKIQILPKGDEEPGFAFEIITRYEDWEDKRARRARFPHTLLVVLLLFLSIISLALGVYVWFFSSSNFLSLQYQFLLALLITVPYFGLIFSIIFNRIAPPSTT